MVQNGEINERQGKYLKPQDCYAPRLIGYPKVHKEGIPLCGVISTIGSPYDKISKALKPILKSLQGRSGQYVKNSYELKERVKGWRIERDETIVSYEVVSLYPSIPIEAALDLVQSLLMSKRGSITITSWSIQSIMKLLRWIFSLFYCGRQVMSKPL